eukprot:939363_1
MICIGFISLLFCNSIAVGEIKQKCWPTDIGCKTYTTLTVLSGLSYTVETSVARDCLPNGDMRSRRFDTRYCTGIVTDTTTTAAANLLVPCGECNEYALTTGSIYKGCTGTPVGSFSSVVPVGCDAKGKFTTCTDSMGVFNTYYENDDCTGAIVNEEEVLVGDCEYWHPEKG